MITPLNITMSQIFDRSLLDNIINNTQRYCKDDITLRIYNEVECCINIMQFDYGVFKSLVDNLK